VGNLDKVLGDQITLKVVNGTSNANWKYYQLTVTSFSEVVQLHIHVTSGNICLGYGANLVPAECNLPQEFLASSAPIICSLPNTIIIGVYQNYSGVEQKPFSFEVEADDPDDNSMCQFRDLGFGIFATVLLGFVLICLVSSIVYFVLSRRQDVDPEELLMDLDPDHERLLDEEYLLDD